MELSGILSNSLKYNTPLTLFTIVILYFAQPLISSSGLLKNHSLLFSSTIIIILNLFLILAIKTSKKKSKTKLSLNEIESNEVDNDMNLGAYDEVSGNKIKGNKIKGDFTLGKKN